MSGFGWSALPSIHVAMDVGRTKDTNIAPAYAQDLDCSQLKINHRPGERGC